MVRDQLIAAVRVGMKTAIGGALAWAATHGWIVDNDAVIGAAIVIGTGLASTALDWAATKMPWLNKFLSWGMSEAGPSYGG